MHMVQTCDWLCLQEHVPQSPAGVGNLLIGCNGDTALSCTSSKCDICGAHKCLSYRTSPVCNGYCKI